MKSLKQIALLLIILSAENLLAQSGHYMVERVPFSSGINDEFSPVFLGKGIVFCSNQRDNSLIGFSDDRSRLFNLFYTEPRKGSRWKLSRLLAGELSSGFNDGPSTFDQSGNIIYFSRNNRVRNVLRNIDDTSNTLGIYSAVMLDGLWSDIRPFPYNDPAYTFTTPALTPSAKRLYFASDRPEGMGGMDLYFCDRNGEEWEEPVNMGPPVNSPGNESFPFANDYGKVFFASDGHGGLGGKDIYYTREINGQWIEPVSLDSAINSPYDDFGLVADSSIESGYFSSNRLGTDDIFSFSTPPVEFPQCDSIMENNFCFTLFDEQAYRIDTIPSLFVWDFGNGVLRYGEEVRHCFPGPGRYIVRLSIYDEFTGDTLSDRVEYRLNLENRQQAYINSNAVGLADEPLVFDGTPTNLSNFMITDYYWDFGDGFAPGAPLMTHTFKRKSEYTVRMGLLSAPKSSGLRMKTCVRRKIRIYTSMEELDPALVGNLSDLTRINPDTAGLETDPLSEDPDTYSQERDPDVEGSSMFPAAYVLDRGEPDFLDARYYFMGDLSEWQKSSIENALRGYLAGSIAFDNYGIGPPTTGSLEAIAGLLKESPELRLEMMISGSTVSERFPAEICSHELAFYFGNLGVDPGAFRSQVFVPSALQQPAERGWVEFLFMKKDYD